MARMKNTRLVTRDHYDDLDLAVKELGTLWILDRINAGLAYNRMRKQEMHDKRHPSTSDAAIPPQGDSQ